MAYSNTKSRKLTPDEKGQILKLHYEDKLGAKEIAERLNIANGGQVSALINGAATMPNGASAAVKAVQNYEKRHADSAIVPDGNPLLDGKSAAVTALLSPQAKERGLLRQSTVGEVYIHRTKPRHGCIGRMPYPFSLDDVGRKFKDGDYVFEIWRPGARDAEFVPQTITGYGPPSFDPSYDGGENMNYPQAQPAAQSPAESVKAIGEAMKVVEDLRKPAAAPKAEPGPVEVAQAKFMDAMTQKALNPAPQDQAANRAMTVDDYLKAQQGADAAHNRRMEEIRVESAGYAQKVKADAEAAATKMKAETDAALAKMKEDATIRESERAAFYVKQKELDDAAYSRRERELLKAVKDSETAITKAEENLKAELASERKRDGDLNTARFDLLKEQANSLTAVAKVQAELLTVKASATKDDDWAKVLDKLHPIVKEVVDAATAKAALDTNPNAINNAMANPAAMAAMASASKPANQTATEKVMASQIEQALASESFKQFMESYCLDFESEMEKFALTKIDPEPNGIFRQLSANAFDARNPESPKWMNIATEIKRRSWPKMRKLLWNHVTDEQKKLLDHAKHELFFEKFRAKIDAAITSDTQIWEHNVRVTEEAIRLSESQAQPKAEPATGGDGERPPKKATASATA